VQSQTILKEVENVTGCCKGDRTHERDDTRSPKVRSRSGSSSTTRLAYLAAHLECLRLILAVLLQTLYTAQSIMWSK
jgi:hypothetical protein